MPRCAVETMSMESFLSQAGYLALILFAFVEACSIPISSEITFGFAGVLAHQGHLNLALVIIIGTLAEFAGSFTSYAVGRKGGRPAVDRFGRYVLLTQRDVDRAERFFAGRGAWAILIARVVPLLRAFAGLVAGLIEVPVGPFAVFNLIGTFLWARGGGSGAQRGGAGRGAGRLLTRDSPGRRGRQPGARGRSPGPARQPPPRRRPALTRAAAAAAQLRIGQAPSPPVPGGPSGAAAAGSGRGWRAAAG
jgi:membrane protein DedA with SNARE-associated domain